MCHSAIRSMRSHRGKAPGRTPHVRGMEHPGSSCRNVWPLFSKCSQHLKKTIQKGGVIFGQVEEAGKHLSAMHSPGAGLWWQLKQQTSQYCYRAPSQGHLLGQ